jgi:hypothetical protein
MADMGIKNGKVSYLDSNGNVVYNLPTTGTNGNMDLTYTPAQNSDWNTVPTTLGQALDELASRLTTLGG